MSFKIKLQSFVCLTLITTQAKDYLQSRKIILSDHLDKIRSWLHLHKVIQLNLLLSLVVFNQISP